MNSYVFETDFGGGLIYCDGLIYCYVGEGLVVHFFGRTIIKLLNLLWWIIIRHWRH